MVIHPQQLFFKIAASTMRFGFIFIFAVAGLRAAMVGLSGFADDLVVAGSIGAMPQRDIITHLYALVTVLVFTVSSILLLMNAHARAVYAVVAGLYLTFTVWQVVVAPEVAGDVSKYVPTLFALLFATVFEYLAIPPVPNEPLPKRSQVDF